jgi:hypothetical protein
MMKGRCRKVLGKEEKVTAAEPHLLPDKGAGSRLPCLRLFCFKKRSAPWCGGSHMFLINRMDWDLDTGSGQRWVVLTNLFQVNFDLSLCLLAFPSILLVPFLVLVTSLLHK